MASHTKTELRVAATALAACIPASARGPAELHLADGEDGARPAGVFDGLADAA
jgi:hypothetical protein